VNKIENFCTRRINQNQIRQISFINRGRQNIFLLSPPNNNSFLCPLWCHQFIRTKNNTMSRLVLNVEDPNEMPHSSGDSKQPNKSASDLKLVVNIILFLKK
jgi:hypothetical protein